MLALILENVKNFSWEKFMKISSKIFVVAFGFFGTIAVLAPSISFAKSGYNILNTNKLYVFVCGLSQANCSDMFVYKNTYYNLGFDFIDPVRSAEEKSEFVKYLKAQRTQQAQIMGPLSATVSIQQMRSNGLKDLVILGWIR